MFCKKKTLWITYNVHAQLTLDLHKDALIPLYEYVFIMCVYVCVYLFLYIVGFKCPHNDSKVSIQMDY